MTVFIIIYINTHEEYHLACAPRERRLFENGGCDGEFITESDFDEDEDFFAHILIYILIELMINNLSILLSFSLMNWSSYFNILINYIKVRAILVSLMIWLFSSSISLSFSKILSCSYRIMCIFCVCIRLLLRSIWVINAKWFRI